MRIKTNMLNYRILGAQKPDPHEDERITMSRVYFIYTPIFIYGEIFSGQKAISDLSNDPYLIEWTNAACFCA